MAGGLAGLLDGTSDILAGVAAVAVLVVAHQDPVGRRERKGGAGLIIGCHVNDFGRRERKGGAGLIIGCHVNDFGRRQTQPEAQHNQEDGQGQFGLSPEVLTGQNQADNQQSWQQDHQIRLEHGAEHHGNN
ncbi:hypothetical protein ATX68_09955 [Oenococcus oeni]|nr:hypothetical protein ATX68_09955 [Oenococcus oeni]